MIRGLVMLPWFESARRDPDSLGIADCQSCKKSSNQVTRQAIGCGYEPPAPPGIPVRPWDHTGRKPSPGELDERGRQHLQICPGYVCRLPEVIETARARLHWEKGELVSFCGGAQPSDRLIDAIEILDGAVAEFRYWDATKEQ
jgi:hypothetical protein